MNSKTPINWENVKSLPDNYQGIVESILACCDLKFQSNHWFSNDYGLHFFNEDYFMFDGLIEWFKSEILKEKSILFSAIQAREIINLYSSWYEFMSIDDPKISEDNPLLESYILNYPEWKKVCEQAQLALKLLLLPLPGPAKLSTEDANALKKLIEESPHDAYMSQKEFRKMLKEAAKDFKQNDEKS